MHKRASKAYSKIPALQDLLRLCEDTSRSQRGQVCDLTAGVGSKNHPICCGDSISSDFKRLVIDMLIALRSCDQNQFAYMVSLYRLQVPGWLSEAGNGMGRAHSTQKSRTVHKKGSNLLGVTAEKCQLIILNDASNVS